MPAITWCAWDVGWSFCKTLQRIYCILQSTAFTSLYLYSSPFSSWICSTNLQFSRFVLLPVPKAICFLKTWSRSAVENTNVKFLAAPEAVSSLKKVRSINSIGSQNLMIYWSLYFMMIYPNFFLKYGCQSQFISLLFLYIKVHLTVLRLVPNPFFHLNTHCFCIWLAGML